MTPPPVPSTGETARVFAPASGNRRFPLLDAMRALSALLIVTTHASGLADFNATHPFGAVTARMNVGVTVFFVISGFLLYRPYALAADRGRPRPNAGRFYRHRTVRVLPGYWLALTLLAIWPGLYGVFTGDWWIYYFLLQVYGESYILRGLGVAWSLATEVAFYACLPLLAVVVGRLRGAGPAGRRREIGLLAGLGLASIVVRGGLHAIEQPALANTLPATFLWFAVGMVLAVVSVATEGEEERWPLLRLVVRRPWVPWCGAAAVLAILSWGLGLPRAGLVRVSVADYVAEFVLFGLFSLLFLLPATFGDDRGGWPRRLLHNRVLAWFGLVSYGIFLWHIPLMIWLWEQGATRWIPELAFPVLLGTSLAFATVCAAASFYLVERPILRFKDGRPRHRDGGEAVGAGGRPAARSARS